MEFRHQRRLNRNPSPAAPAFQSKGTQTLDKDSPILGPDIINKWLKHGYGMENELEEVWKILGREPKDEFEYRDAIRRYIQNDYEECAKGAYF